MQHSRKSVINVSRAVGLHFAGLKPKEGARGSEKTAHVFKTIPDGEIKQVWSRTRDDILVGRHVHDAILARDSNIRVVRT